jgi:formamidopyrimidine-DNA glycosylase
MPSISGAPTCDDRSRATCPAVDAVRRSPRSTVARSIWWRRYRLGETLLMHLGMSGSFRVIREQLPRRARREASPLDPHDHVVFHMSSGRAVVFNDPRRFGIMELVAAGKLDRHPVLNRLGPEPLSKDFDGAALARACHRKNTSLKAALMDQRVVAGLGNITCPKRCIVAGLSPRRTGVDDRHALRRTT